MAVTPKGGAPAGGAAGKGLQVASKVADLVGKIGEAVKGFGDEVLKAVNPLQQLGDAMAKFVALASPADLNLFTNAVADLNASIGQLLLPVFRLVTDSVREAADVLHSLAPLGGTIAAVIKPFFELTGIVQQLVDRGLHQLSEAFETMAPALAAVTEGMLGVYEALRPIIELQIDTFALQWKLLAQVVLEAAPYVVALTSALADFVKWLNNAIREVLAFVGIDLPGGPDRVAKKGESVGAAAKSASFGSVEDQLKKAMASAFSLGTGPDPAKDMAKDTREIKSAADKIYAEIKALPDKIEKWVVHELPTEIATKGVALVKTITDTIDAGVKVITGGGKEIVKRVEKFVGDPVGTVKAEAKKLGDDAKAAARAAGVPEFLIPD